LCFLPLLEHVLAAAGRFLNEDCDHQVLVCIRRKPARSREGVRTGSINPRRISRRSAYKKNKLRYTLGAQPRLVQYRWFWPDEAGKHQAARHCGHGMVQQEVDHEQAELSAAGIKQRDRA
jgi:hypothetical protein